VTKLVYSKNLMRKEFVHFVAPLFIATSSTHFLYFVAFPSSYCNNSKFCGTMNTFFALNWIAYNLWLNWFTIRSWWEKKSSFRTTFVEWNKCHTFFIIAFASFHCNNSELFGLSYGLFSLGFWVSFEWTSYKST
jgi:hypothetical protein